MYKKFISMCVMVAILMFSISCYSTRVYKGPRLRHKPGQRCKIFWVETTSGQHIRFYGNDGAKIINGSVVGETYYGEGDLKVVRIPINQIQKVKMRALNNFKSLLLVTILGSMTVAGATFFMLILFWNIE